jgi:hypothetical protein
MKIKPSDSPPLLESCSAFFNIHRVGHSSVGWMFSMRYLAIRQFPSQVKLII